MKNTHAIRTLKRDMARIKGILYYIAGVLTIKLGGDIVPIVTALRG